MSRKHDQGEKSKVYAKEKTDVEPDKTLQMF